MSREENGNSPWERLKALRGGNRSVVTKLEKEAASVIVDGRDKTDSTHIADINARLNSIKATLREKLRYLKELDAKLLENCAVEGIEKEIEEATSWEARVYEVLSRIEEFAKGNYSRPRPSQPSVPATTVSDSVDDDVNSAASSPARVGTQDLVVQSPGSQSGVPSSPSRTSTSESSGPHVTGVKLPKINLPKFNGDITRFNQFWQSFECAVHKNDSVPVVNKLNYLFSLLEGPAYRAVEGLELQENNYEHVVDILKTRFGKKQQIINAHMQALLKLQNHRTLLTQFAQRWKKEYLLSIMESYKGKPSMDKPVIEVGDIVVLRNDGTKRSFWKLGKIVKLFTGADGHTRGAKVEVSTGKEGKTFLNRPLQHLVPLEVNSKTLDKRSSLRVQSASTGASSDAARNRIVCDRPRRNAAIIGQMRRRDAMQT